MYYDCFIITFERKQLFSQNMNNVSLMVNFILIINCHEQRKSKYCNCGKH